MFNIRLTPIVKNIIIANVVAFLVVYAIGRLIDTAKLDAAVFGPLLENYTALFKTNWLGLYGPQVPNYFNPIQLITHFFVHFAPFHILFNMLALASLGPSVERVLGPKRFLMFYLFSGIIGGLIVAIFDPSPNPIIGASGAVFGVMYYFAHYYPEARLSVMFLPPIAAKQLMRILVVGSAGLVLLQVLGNFVPALADFDGWGISHFGHLSGVIAAFIFFYVEKYLPSV